MPNQQQSELIKSCEMRPVGIAILDPDLCYTYCNRALAEINGIPAADHVGKSVGDFVPDIALAADARFRSVFKTGIPIRGLKVTGDRPALAAVPRTWLENVEPIWDDAGRVSHVLVTVEEVTGLQEARSDLAQVEAILHASQQLNPDGFAILRAVRDECGKTRDFAWEYANPAAQSFVGLAPLVGQKWSQIFPDAAEQAFSCLLKALETREPTDLTLPEKKQTETLWHYVKVVPVDCDRVAISYRDISPLKQAEAQMQLLVSEYRHRIKNTLAVVIGLASLGAKSAPSAAAMDTTLRGQLVALGAAQDIVGVLPCEEVDLAELVFAVLKPFRAANLYIEGGPRLQVHANAAVPLSLLLNELATNALKYGGLASDNGSVCVHWLQQENRLLLIWCESGATQSIGHIEAGEGSKLLRTIESMLPNAQLQFDVLATGVLVKLDFDMR